MDGTYRIVGLRHSLARRYTIHTTTEREAKHIRPLTRCGLFNPCKLNHANLELAAAMFVGTPQRTAVNPILHTCRRYFVSQKHKLIQS